MAKRVKFIQSVAGNGLGPCGKQYPSFSFPEGYVGDLTDEQTAQAWIDSGICEIAQPDDQCRPPKPDFAVAITPEAAIIKRGLGRPKSVPVVAVAETVVEKEGS